MSPENILYEVANLRKTVNNYLTDDVSSYVSKYPGCSLRSLIEAYAFSRGLDKASRLVASALSVNSIVLSDDMKVYTQ